MTTQHAPYDTHTDASELSTMHTCSLCGDYVTLPCETCSAIYADDLPLELGIQWTDDDYNQEMDDYYN